MEIKELIKGLTETYLENAFYLCKNNEITLNQFYENIREIISKKFNLPTEKIAFIDHPFHWFLFLDEEGFLEINYQQKQVNGRTTIRIRSNKSLESYFLNEKVKIFLKKYGGLLEKKIQRNLG
jgi:hypothetical protein